MNLDISSALHVIIVTRNFVIISRDLSNSQLSGDVAGLFQDFTSLESL